MKWNGEIILQQVVYLNFYIISYIWQNTLWKCISTQGKFVKSQCKSWDEIQQYKAAFAQKNIAKKC